MKEYIERETYYQQINDLSKGKHGDYCAAIQDCMTTLDEQPAADVAPVRHGEWTQIEYTTLYKCSACMAMINMPYQIKLFDYCPECGAYMDGGNK